MTYPGQPDFIPTYYRMVSAGLRRFPYGSMRLYWAGELSKILLGGEFKNMFIEDDEDPKFVKILNNLERRIRTMDILEERFDMSNVTTINSRNGQESMEVSYKYINTKIKTVLLVQKMLSSGVDGIVDQQIQSLFGDSKLV